jgi:hypothetical protein
MIVRNITEGYIEKYRLKRGARVERRDRGYKTRKRDAKEAKITNGAADNEKEVCKKQKETKYCLLSYSLLT